jgi:hypothetical protein
MKSIILICFNRPNKLSQTLACLKQTKDIERWQLVVIRQHSDDADCNKVAKIIDNIDWISTTHLTTTYTPTETVVSKISKNIYKGLTYSFEKIKSDIAILIEDDICLGYDALIFFETMINRYNNDPFFYAVNGFSYKTDVNHLKFSYSKFRFGIGNGWAISKKKWHSFYKKKWPHIHHIGFDTGFETCIKMGYVIMPYAARSNDIGFGEKAAHSPKIKTQLFKDNDVSWVGVKPFEQSNYYYIKNKHFPLRNDCVHFSWFSPITYILFRLARKTLYVIFRKDITKIIPTFFIKRFVNITKN